MATDIGVVRPVIFDSGDLALAVRASMAVPGAFSPVEYNGKVLVDGGIVNNLPIDVMRGMGVDRLIIVDVAEPLLPPDQVRTGPAILLQMITGLMMARTEEQLRNVTPRDLLLRPDLGDLGSVDFVTSTKGIDLGEQAAMAEVERLRTFAVPEGAVCGVAGHSAKSATSGSRHFIRARGYRFEPDCGIRRGPAQPAGRQAIGPGSA